jgi:signal transduction histidine kinase/CheY-like chemotaxis protein
MMLSFDTLGAKLYPLLDWFIPEQMKRERELLLRARMFLISHLFGPFLGHTISLYVLFIDPRPDAAWFVFFGTITAFWAFPFALKLTGRFVPLALISVQNLIFTILWGCYHYGGTSSPLVPWVITVPLLSFFYLGSGKAVRAFVLGIIVLNLGAFYWIYSFGHGFPEHIPLSSLSGLGLVSTACAAMYVSMMALYYANIATSQSDLEREVKKSMETAHKLREAADEASRASRAKSEFLAKMSHELRTPLNAVIGYSAIMIDEMKASARQAQCEDLKKIHNAGKRLLKLISDLLDLSKLEAGKMELFIEPIKVDSLIEDVIEEFQEQLTKSGNRLTVDCAPSLTIEGDQIKLRRAICDVVSNAIKFTTDGEIWITAKIEGENLSISVDDTGIGIDPYYLTMLFESFKQLEDESSSKYDQAGLGLPVSQKLCELMGGRIVVHSTRGTGSSFTIRVPAKLSADVQPAGAEIRPTPLGPGNEMGPPILVIDDDAFVLDEVAKILSAEGYAVVCAPSSADGLAMATQHPPAAVLLDVLMPERDGWETLKLIKADPRLANCPVIMLTIDDNVKKSSRLGADGHVVKPLNRLALLLALRHAGIEPLGDKLEASPAPTHAIHAQRAA